MMKTLKSYVADFGFHFTSALEHISNMAKEYAGAINAYSQSAQDAFELAYPHVTANTWSKLLMIGNGDLNPNVMFFSDKFAMKIGRMPIEKQNEVLNGDSFDVFNPTTRKVERVNYGQIKPRHERILFDEKNTTIRSIEEQVAYSDIVAAEKKANYRPYEIKTNGIDVKSACFIGKDVLEQALEDME